MVVVIYASGDGEVVVVIAVEAMVVMKGWCDSSGGGVGDSGEVV